MKREGKSLKEILKMINGGGNQGCNERGIIVRIANKLC